ncbi:hypothetical protein Btru_063697 [Bulinus truncatus]|nr:hypothetical protein Btru_063697 [Bulinus truncatus]
MSNKVKSISGENCSNCKLSKLIQAIQECDTSIFNALISDRRLINEIDRCGWTPLMHGVNSNNLEFVKSLCDRGATANIKDGHFRNPLMIATIKGFTDIVKFLVPKVSDLNAVDNYGMSAFMHAAKNGKLDIVAELFDKGVDVNFKDKNGFTAFMLASIEHHTEISGVQVSVVCEEDMQGHPFIDLLQKSGCHLSFSRDGGSRPNRNDLERLSEEKHNEREPGNRNKHLYDLHNSSHCSDIAPHSEITCEETETPFIMRKLKDDRPVAVLDLPMPHSYITLGEGGLTKEGSEKENDDEAYLRFLHRIRDDLQLLNRYDNYDKEFRTKNDSSEASKATGLTFEENHFKAEDITESVTRVNRSIKGRRSQRNAVYFPTTNVNKQNPKGKQNGFKKIILNCSFKNFTIMNKKMKLNVEKCENLTTGDQSPINVNK